MKKAHTLHIYSNMIAKFVINHTINVCANIVILLFSESIRHGAVSSHSFPTVEPNMAINCKSTFRIQEKCIHLSGDHRYSTENRSLSSEYSPC